ncbi:MAG TPA: hypothetical protein VKZ60_04710 [Chloroflexota bacterium]|nr:hypothetical protein [Chloroflexota bacterium]
MLRADSVELLAIGLLVVAVFVAARTWGGGAPLPQTALLVLAAGQALWVLGVLPPVGLFPPRVWAAIACGMLVVLGVWLAGFGLKRSTPLAALVTLAAGVELLVLAGALTLG